MVGDKTPITGRPGLRSNPASNESQRSYTLRNRTVGKTEEDEENSSLETEEPVGYEKESDVPFEYEKESAVPVKNKKKEETKNDFVYDFFYDLLNKCKKDLKKIITVIGAVVICLLLLGLFFKFLNYINSPKSFEVNISQLSPEEKQLHKFIEGLKKDYPSQDKNTWITFLAGIKSITRTNPNKPSVFLMLYDDNETTAYCIAKRMSPVAVEFLTGEQKRPLILKGEDLKESTKFSRDSGEVIEQYKNEVEKNHAMVVTELHEVPGWIADSFHFFCDRETPLVEKAIYFFTLKKSQREYRNLQESAEETLRDLWSESLTDNILAPLITRLTGNVIQIQPESYVTKSC